MRKFCFILLVVVFCTSGLAYTRLTVTNGETPKWSSMPVSYWINEKGLSQIQNGSEFAAVQSSFQTWENVSTADIRFAFQGTTTTSGVGRDSMNVVTFADETMPLGSSTIAVTLSFFRSEIGSDNVLRLVVAEADIAFNPALEFSTSAEDNKFDIQSILTHEVGHMLGLDHSALISSVMQPFGAVSRLDLRTLAYDDAAGVSEIYPRAGAAAGFGQIRGTIRSDTGPVFGAHVVAVDSEGTPLVSTLSKIDGSYVLELLRPGAYRVYAEPLDLPVRNAELGGFFSSARTDFGTTFFGDVSNLTDARTVSVSANGAGSADILTLPRGASGLNLTRPAIGARVARGVSGLLTVGGEDLRPGISITASNPGLFLGSPAFGGRISTVASTSVRMDLAIDPSTPLGPKNLAVNRGGDASILSGAIVVTDATPSGSAAGQSIAVAPANGPVEGGTPVTITGANFRPGAQVYFGGLPATSITNVNSGTILVNAPPNSPGPVNVVVINTDGTWGTAFGGFNYDGQLPVITRITPSTGPPATLVTIEGANFDSRSQNVAVQFNGIAARIVSTRATSITTLVPYGASTGPVTVTVFGKSVNGPVFTVTSVAASTNLATPRFNFIDASVASGGTQLSFTNNDDGLASVFLPFTFSLFRDVYLAGSPVSIATNGFLSLETLSVAEFQNGSLPGQSVVRPSGATGIIPPSLIAPFWDDLLMKSNSAITTRTAGVAPNRQFVVQWTNLSVFDEEGRDQNAILTFEVVLFEGSNDVQFLYHTASGPRSDGSGATIGMQNLRKTAAVQSGFNQPVVSPEQVWTYRFQNGGYVELTADTTPPALPVVTDEGALSANATQLAASWVAADPESGISEFSYAIGTTAGGAEIRPFTSTKQNSIVVSGLTLQSGATYYFAVKAVNGAGLPSGIAVSDGIRFDPTYQPQFKFIPSARQGAGEFTGLALFAPAAMSVVLRAFDAGGAQIFGSGILNPMTIPLAAGQQYAKLLPELLGLQTFDGWIEAEASGPGLGIFAATGAWDTSTLDGSIVRDPSADFILFHTGASAVLVNPSSRAANVTMTSLTGRSPQTFAIPPRGAFKTVLSGAVRVQSSEPLAASEQSSASGKLTMNAAVPLTDAQSSLVFPHAVVGGGYKSTLLLANAGSTAQSVQVDFGAPGAVFLVQPNSSIEVPVTSAVSGVVTGAVTVTAVGPFASRSVIGILDIENESGWVTMGARPAATDFAFPHVANGNGLFTGLAFAAGSSAATITIEVYEPAGGSPKSSTITLGPNQQLGRLVSELVAGTAAQVGGYIRIRSDQPIWAWEIYGSGTVMASGPPL